MLEVSQQTSSRHIFDAICSLFFFAICTAQVTDIEVLLMDDLDIHTFSAARMRSALYLICISTYCQGAVPDNACALYDSLAAEPQFLGHARHGVIALGDRTYLQTFCFGGKKLTSAWPTSARNASVTYGATTPALAPCRKKKVLLGAATG